MQGDPDRGAFEFGGGFSARQGMCLYSSDTSIKFRGASVILPIMVSRPSSYMSNREPGTQRESKLLARHPGEQFC